MSPAGAASSRPATSATARFQETPVSGIRPRVRRSTVRSDCSGSRTTWPTGTRIRTVRIGRLEDPTVSDPRLAILRTDASVRLESVVLNDSHPKRRSAASNLLGVLSIVAFNAQGAGGGGAPDRTELLLNAIASFRQAIEFDPDNADAKFNLEALLQRGAGLLPTEAAGGKKPQAGGRGSRGAGAGEPGSGY